MTLSYAIWWFARPSQFLALVLLAGLLIWIFGFRRTGRWFITIGGGGLVLAGLTPIGLWLIGLVESNGRTLSGESKVAAAILLGAGIAPDRLTLEDRSRNTCENAALSKERVKPKAQERWLLVTSAFHMPRAMACFRASDWDVIPYPTDFKRSPNLRFDPTLFSFVGNLSTLDQAAHEWLGLAYYRLLGLIDEM